MSLWQNKFIKPSKFTRPQKKLTGVRKIVIHWTANYGATALNHFNYFNSLKDRYASAHLFVDKKEALCLIPLDEVAYHANDGSYRGILELQPNANMLSIGVEMCVEKDGSFHPDMLSRTVEIVAELCKQYNLDPIADVVRHYDITHKSCPTPFVKNPQQFVDFKNDVKFKLNGNKAVAGVSQEKPMWGKTEFRKGQIGKITILKNINLWKDVNGKLVMVRVLNPTEEYRVYDYRDAHGGQYNLGDGHWVTKMSGYILYETPSKKLLAEAEKFYK